VTKFAFDNMQTSNVFSTFDECFTLCRMRVIGQSCSETDFICHEANTFSNNNKTFTVTTELVLG